MVDGHSISSSDGSESSLSSENTYFKGPKKYRSCTDCSFLVIFLLVLLSLFGFIMYCIMNSDIRRVYNGYDECGYICGYQNEPTSSLKKCINNANKEDQPYLKMEAPLYEALNLANVTRKCVKTCDKTYKIFVHRCIPTNFTNNNIPKTYQDINSFLSMVFQDLLQTKSEIIILCIFAFILSHFILCMLRFVVGIVVWLILVGVAVGNFTGSIFLWSLIYSEKEKKDIAKTDKDEHNFMIHLTFAIILTIITITIMIIILAIRKRVALVVQLFKEAGKAIENMPTLLVQPVGTFSLLSLIVVVWFNNALFIESSGFLSNEPYSHTEALYYKKNFIMKFTRIYNILIFFWIIQFIIACQHMVVAGAVSSWYFTRNKNDLTFPLLRSTCYLLKYHLGSAAYGSLIINLVTISKNISVFFSKICKKSENKVVTSFYIAFQCMFCYLHEFLQYLTRNAYVEISIYGDNFSRSGKRASDIITSNKLRVSAINFVGDFVLIMIKVLVVILNTVVGYMILEANYSQKSREIRLWVPLTVVGFFSYFVAHCFISVYEMLIDSLFVCFCEDCSLNNASEEYFMSKELMDFVVRNQNEENVPFRPQSFVII